MRNFYALSARRQRLSAIDLRVGLQADCLLVNARMNPGNTPEAPHNSVKLICSDRFRPPSQAVYGISSICFVLISEPEASCPNCANDFLKTEGYHD
jgi:hypothetical protein